MLTLIAFSLLLLQSSLDEVFNPRLRRGKLAKRKTKGGQPLPAPVADRGPRPRSGRPASSRTPSPRPPEERR